jgi:hypothetical protein
MKYYFLPELMLVSKGKDSVTFGQRLRIGLGMVVEPYNGQPIDISLLYF